MSKSNEGNNVSFWFSLLAFFMLFFFFFVILGKKRTKTLVQKDSLEGEQEDLNRRQRKILEILSSEGEVTIGDIMKKIKGITERTLRRDMKKLEQLDLSRKEGTTKGSKYIYIGK